MSDNDEFVRSLELATIKMVTETVANMKVACMTVERDAKKNCNVDQGITRASITHNVDFNTREIIGSVFSNQDNAPYLEKGTGIYAKDHNGRKTPWYVPAKNYKGKKRPTFQGKVVKVYGKNNAEFYKTDGMKPHPFLEPARDANKDKIAGILAGKKT